MDNLKVLICEDDTDLAGLYELVFQANGWRVHKALRAESAVEAARTGSYDLVIADLHLPGMSGAVLVQELRRFPRTRDVPVIVISSMITEEDADRCMRFGASGVLSKPVEPSSLMEICAKILKGEKIVQPTSKAIRQDISLACARRSGRIGLEQDVVLTLPSGFIHECTTIDVSPQGVGVIAPLELSFGQRLKLVVRDFSSKTSNSKPMNASVVSCKEYMSPDLYRLGLRLDPGQASAEQQLQRMVFEAERRSLLNKTRFVRAGAQRIVVDDLADF